MAYAKAARLYLQQMNSLQTTVSETEYKQFTENGYFTVRKTDLFGVEMFQMKPLKKISRDFLSLQEA